MSALSDVENLRLHDISDGDVRDDPRWLDLMGESALKAFLQEMARKHLPGQHNQDSHGNDHGVDVIPGDNELMPDEFSGDLPKSSRRDTQNKHLPGRHDQSSHGRGRRRTPDVDVPDVPKPEPVAEPKPPKPRRAPKPKPKPPAEAPKPATASWTADVAKVGDMFATGPRAEPTPEQLATMNTVFAGTHADLQTKDVRMRFIGKSTVEFNGGIFDQQGARVGFFSRTMTREPDGTMAATHDRLTLDPTVRGQGFAQSFNGRLIEWYKASGVKQVQLSANIDVGGYAWARAGYDWYDEDAIADPFKQLRWVAAGRRAQRIPAERLDEQMAQAAAMVKRFETAEFGSADFPTPYELSQVGRWPGAGKDDWWAGKAAMMGSSWDGVKPL